MNTVQAQWESFLAQALPDGAHPVQIQEMRRSFYAGAAAMRQLTATASDLSEDAGTAVLESLLIELNEFGNAVMRGEA